MSDVMRAAIDAIWPEGSAWKVATDEGTDNLLNGAAENWEVIRAFLAKLADIRDPKLTGFLSDLENEFGVFTNLNLTEQQRRDQLSSVVFNRSSNGSIDQVQKALDDAGFNVTVYSNDPAVDPASLLDEIFQMVAGGGTGYAGRSDAFAGRVGGDLLVNGDVFFTKRIFTSVAGTMYAGDGSSAGEYSLLERTRIEYQIPLNPDSWPFVFFVGGDATFDGSGALTSINAASVPAEQQSEFKRIILKYKPIHSWAGLIVSYV